jgi:hypothetical protein
MIELLLLLVGTTRTILKDGESVPVDFCLIEGLSMLLPVPLDALLCPYIDDAA